MQDRRLQEDILGAWIGLNGMLKNSRVTKDMSYNEAIVMRIVMKQYETDGIGKTPVKQIIAETRMLKSLANRTINMLCDKGYLIRQKDEKDARNIMVMPVVERLGGFMDVHERSLQLAQDIIDAIGEEDAQHFIRICAKLHEGDIRLPEQEDKQ